MKREYFLVAAVIFTVLSFVFEAPPWFRYCNLGMTVLLFVHYTFRK